MECEWMIWTEKEHYLTYGITNKNSFRHLTMVFYILQDIYFGQFMTTGLKRRIEVEAFNASR